MFGTKVRTHALPKTDPNRIMLCGKQSLLYLVLRCPFQFHRCSPLVLEGGSKQILLIIVCNALLLKSMKLTNTSIWSFGAIKMRPFKHKAVGIPTSWSLNIVFSPFDLISSKSNSSAIRLICNFSAAHTLIISAVVHIGKRKVQYVWSVLYTRNMTSSSGRIMVRRLDTWPLNNDSGCPFGGSFHFWPACSCLSSFNDRL